MPEILRAVGDPQSVDEMGPVALHCLHDCVARMAGDVIHDGEDTAMRF